MQGGQLIHFYDMENNDTFIHFYNIDSIERDSVRHKQNRIVFEVVGLLVFLFTFLNCGL